MDLTSAQFDERASIPRAHTCDGEDIPPDLRWSGVRGGIVELALTCEDPDAPSGTFVHWAAWGIDPSAGHLRTDRDPRGHQRIRAAGLRGAVPVNGHGPHRYVFTLSGVDQPIELEPGASIVDLRSIIEGQIRATATLTGTYER
jgi:Raf kinase inhibitor-like YbhB/YbcL family protein